jgi:hypothetical protein
VTRGTALQTSSNDAASEVPRASLFLKAERHIFLGEFLFIFAFFYKGGCRVVSGSSSKVKTTSINTEYSAKTLLVPTTNGSMHNEPTTLMCMKKRLNKRGLLSRFNE